MIGGMRHRQFAKIAFVACTVAGLSLAVLAVGDNKPTAAESAMGWVSWVLCVLALLIFGFARLWKP
jgi:hypothetical protein